MERFPLCEATVKKGPPGYRTHDTHDVCRGSVLDF